MAVLLVGFKPYGEYPENPSEIVVETLDGTEVEGVEIVGAVLPVSFRAAREEALRLVEEHRPLVAIGVGLSPRRVDVGVEKVALNYMYSERPDADGYKPKGEPVIPGGPDALFATIPVERVLEALRESYIPASISLSAGSYVCNALMYTLIYYTRRYGGLAGFLHVPLPPCTVARLRKQLPSLSLSLVEEAVTITVREALREAVLRGD